MSMAHQRSRAVTATFVWTGAAVFALSLGWFAYSYLIRFGRPGLEGPVAGPVLANAALFTAFAAHHSLLARSGIKAALRRRLPVEIERSLYTWTASLLFLAVCTFWQPVPGVWYELRGAWAVAGYAVQALGLLLTARGAAAVDALDLAGVRPMLDAAHGSEPRHVPLETRGVYGFVRHPLYFAWALFVFGAPVMTATRGTFAVVSTAYLMLAIPWEERGLVEVFGPRYEAYRRQVRWRMIPFIY